MNLYNYCDLIVSLVDIYFYVFTIYQTINY